MKIHFDVGEKSSIGFLWCERHQRWESVGLRTSELTREYLDAHPEVVNQIFGSNAKRRIK